jgi:uncharacterized membrane protein YoaK (UPF0700 family)
MAEPAPPPDPRSASLPEPPPDPKKLPGTAGSQPAGPVPSGTAEVRARAEHLSVSSLLATAGGFLDGFTYVGHGHVFANAMTGNVVLLGVETFVNRGGNHSLTNGSLRHLPPILMFLLGVCAARALDLERIRRLRISPYAAVLIIEIGVLLVLAWLPNSTSNFLLTSSIAFAASMQVQTFRSVGGYSYNSTFTTGNLRMLSVGLFDWRFGRDAEVRSQARTASRIFGTICAVFLLGATLGGLAVTHLGNRALLIEIAFLLLVLWLIESDGLLSVKQT